MSAGDDYDDMSSGAVESVAAAHPDDDERGDFDTPELARYRVERVLGVGGMGRVLGAHDRRLDREVALKEARTDTGDSALLEARLVREACITARLDHPGIVPVLDAGTRADGRAYYVMPVVRGRSLRELLNDARAARRPRTPLLRRLLEAAEAVGAAHRTGVVHRDLKPSNIMIGDGGGTRVLDWGLATTSAALTVPVSPSRSPAGVVGTPPYVSPELLAGAPADARADVWSLGAMLFEVLTGRKLRTDTMADSHRARVIDAAKLPPELAAIVRRATATLTERYPDAGALAEDLARYLDGRPVTAHRYSARELLLRFIHAWRIPLTIAGAALVLVITLLLIGIDRLSSEADRARNAELEARTALDVADERLASSLTLQSLVHSARGARAEAEVVGAAALRDRDSPLARGALLRWSAAQRPTLVARDPLPACLGYAFDEPGERLLCRTADGLEAWSLRPLERLWSRGINTSIAIWWSGDVAFYHGDRNVGVLDGSTGAFRYLREGSCGFQSLMVAGPRLAMNGASCLWSILPDTPWSEPSITPCPAGYTATATLTSAHEWLAACSDGAILVGTFDEAREDPLRITTPFETPHVVLALARLDPTRLVLGTNRGEILVMGRDGSGPVVATNLNQIIGLHVAPGHDLVVAAGAVGAPLIFDPRAGLVVGQLDDGQRHYIGFHDRELFDVNGGLARWRFARGPIAGFDVSAGVTSLAFDSTGAMLAVAHADGAEVRNIGIGDLVLSFTSRVGGVTKAVAFGIDDGTLFAVGGREPPRSMIDLRGISPLVASSGLGMARRLGVLANGWLIAIPYATGIVVRPAGEPTPWPELELVGHRFGDLAVSAGGAHAALFEPSAANVWIFDLAARALEPRLNDPQAVAVAIGRDPTLVATGGQESVRLWDATTGALLREWHTPSQETMDIAISPDERWVASGTREGTVWLWDLATGALRARMAVHQERVAAITFSHDGRLLASGGWDGEVRLYDTRQLDLSGEQLQAEIERAWGLNLARVLERDEDLWRRRTR